MAFNYGSIDLGITNPFRIEGAIRAASGMVPFVLSIILLFSVQGTIAEGKRELGTLIGIAGVILLVWGLSRLGSGLFQTFRFFVGRSVPANLAENKEKSQDNADSERQTNNIAYDPQQLEQMLQGRQNISLDEPDDWFSRLIHSLFSRLLYLPFAYRNMAQHLARAVTQTLIAITCYVIAWFSGTTGITDVTQTPVMDWFALFLLAYLLFVWRRAGRPLVRVLNEGQVQMPGIGKLAFWITIAILLPAALAGIHEQQVTLPELYFDPGIHLGILALLACIATIFFVALLTGRSRLAHPVVEVAEYRDNWQESIHPQEIFINIESIVMANRRYKEVPNRTYRAFEAELSEKGSDNKGNFGGEMIQEVQPVFHQMPISDYFRAIRIASTATGAVMACAAGIILYAMPSSIEAAMIKPDIQTIISALSMPIFFVMTLTFSRVFQNFSHAFWAEMQFKSLIVYFQCKGTYTSSKLSTGTSIYDSTRSENVLVRSSITPWVLASRIVSSTFAASGSMNLEHARYILEMHKAEDDLKAIIDDLRDFMQNREAIASINNEKDLAATSRIFQVNQQTRAQLDAPTGEHPPLDQERIVEASGENALADKTSDDNEDSG